MTQNNLPQFTIKQMLEAGVHFGHKTMRRNPKMAKYVFDNRNDLSVINLEKTAVHLQNALKTVRDIAKNNGRILFVATKKQAFDAIEESAKRCGQYYVNNRWLGGMLTNWKTISQSIKTLKKIEEQLSSDELGLNKKERLVLDRQRIKLDKALGGIRNMGGSPDLVFIVDTNREALAVAEAKKLGVPIMAILDTNCNPDGITFPIPGNDDSVKAIKLYCRLISDAILSGIKENMLSSGIAAEKLTNVSPEEILEVANSRKYEDKKPQFTKDAVIKKSDKKPVKASEEKEAGKSQYNDSSDVLGSMEVVKAPAKEAANNSSEKKPTNNKNAINSAPKKK